MGDYDRGTGPEGGRQSVGTLDRAGTAPEPDVRAVSAVIERPRRRVLLDVVAEYGPMTTRDLAIQMGARLHDVEPRDVTDEQRQRLAITLHHVDVPKLVATDVLVADEGFDRIRPGPKADRFRSALRGVAGDRDDASKRGRID